MNYELKKVTSGKELKALYKLFDKLGNSDMPTLDEYRDFVDDACVYIVSKNGKAAGGFFMYETDKQFVIMNYYVPPSERNKKLSLDIMEIMLNYRDRSPEKRIFIKSKDVSAYKRFATHVKDDYYEIHIPSRRMH